MTVAMEDERAGGHAPWQSRSYVPVSSVGEEHERVALVRGITHDIKNPLGAAAGFAQLLADGITGPLTDQQTDMLARIRHLISVSLERVEALLELVRNDANEIPVVVRDMDARSLIRDVSADFAGEAREKGLTLIVPGPGQSISMRTDPTRVRRILGNLLSNALKYTPAPGFVSIMLRSTPSEPVAGGRDLVLEIGDTGPGIPPDACERIFEPFVRLPSTSEAVRGAGVGLAAARRMARALGGDITVANAVGGGAVFTVRIPAGDAPGPNRNVGTGS